MTQRYAVNARAFLPTMPEAATCVVTLGNVAFVQMREAEMLDLLILSLLIVFGILVILGVIVFGLAAIWAAMRSSQISQQEEARR